MVSDTLPLLSYDQISTEKPKENILIEAPELDDHEETLLEKIKTIMSKMIEWIEFLTQFIPFVKRKKDQTKQQKQEQKDEFEKKKLKIFIGTWNMHGKLPPFGLKPFIDPPKYMENDVNKFYLKRNSKHPYHILVIGTQECQHNLKHSVFFPSKEEWERRLKKYLGEEYFLVKTETMAALHLAVFVWERCKDWVKDYQHDEVPTGLANLFGNKGGIGISLLFGNTSFCFINGHLAAHKDKVKERNHDVKKICKELKLKGFFPSDKEPFNVTDRFDYVFLFGDLNYRVELERSIADKLIKQNDIKTLLKYDQLSRELKSFSHFKNFHEAPLTFYPTFKFDTTNHHDNEHFSSTDNNQSESTYIRRYDSSPKQRVPSWTDRILWKSRLNKIDTELYTSHADVDGFSDHIPVTGCFFVDFDWNQSLQERKKKSKKKILKKFKF